MPNTSIRASFGATLTKLAKINKNIFVVDVDLKSSLHLNEFALSYPKRFIEAGVAEANATAIAAGLAKSGKTVFLTSFSCFSPAINWAVIKQSICYQNLNVKVIGSHSGLMSGSLGATHQMLEDIALTRCLPNMEVFSPADSIETGKIISAVTRTKKPCYIRLVRPDTPVFFPPRLSFTIGKSQLLSIGKDITIIFHGPIGYQAVDLINSGWTKANKISIDLINASSIKPLDQKTIITSAKKTKAVIVLEDHQKIGGLGEAVAYLLLQNNISAKFIHLAVDNQFGQSAKDYQKLYNFYGIGPDQLKLAIKKLTI